jgi:hypothetical protein
MFLDTRLGNDQHWFLTAPKDSVMRVPEVVRKCVVFLGRVFPKGYEEELYFCGTGFVVSVPSSLPERSHLCLVTAKHVVEMLALGDWFMRVNTKEGGFIDLGVTGPPL